MSNVSAEVAYVAACALGLAVSPPAGQDAVTRLLEGVDGDPARLRAAHGAVAGAPVGDPATRRRAAELLLAAAAVLERRPRQEVAP